MIATTPEQAKRTIELHQEFEAFVNSADDKLDALLDLKDGVAEKLFEYCIPFDRRIFRKGNNGKATYVDMPIGMGWVLQEDVVVHEEVYDQAGFLATPERILVDGFIFDRSGGVAPYNGRMVAPSEEFNLDDYADCPGKFIVAANIDVERLERTLMSSRYIKQYFLEDLAGLVARHNLDFSLESVAA